MATQWDADGGLVGQPEGMAGAMEGRLHGGGTALKVEAENCEDS